MKEPILSIHVPAVADNNQVDLSIDHPLLAALKISLNECLAHALRLSTTRNSVSVTAIITFEAIGNAMESHQQKEILPAKYKVQVGVKAEGYESGGTAKSFTAHFVDDRVLLTDPDRQLEISDLR